jgi:hypothetical protein
MYILIYFNPFEALWKSDNENAVANLVKQDFKIYYLLTCVLPTDLMFFWHLHTHISFAIFNV